MPSQRLPALDGLRGVAILLVIVGHTTPVLAGWVGVELFFVLSGYLITGILLMARDTPYRARLFYARRVLRIWPLYLLALVVLLIALPRLGLYTEPQRAWLTANGWWYWLHLANLGHAFAGNPPDQLTTHLWSLSVEEQYYLLWPAVVWSLTRSQARIACGVIVVIGLFARSFGVPWYLNTLTRLDGIAVGSWIALVGVDRLGPHSRRVGFIAGGILLCTLMVSPTLLPKNDPRFGVWLSTVLAVAFGAVLVHVVAHAPAWSRSWWLGAFGRYSYAIYLFHLPLAVLLRRNGWGRLGLAFPLVVTELSVGLALLSWHAWEKRWLALRPADHRQVAEPPSLAA